MPPSFSFSSAAPPAWSMWPWVRMILSTTKPACLTPASIRSRSPPGSTTTPRLVSSSHSNVQFCWNGVTGTMAALSGIKGDGAPVSVSRLRGRPWPAWLHHLGRCWAPRSAKSDRQQARTAHGTLGPLDFAGETELRDPFQEFLDRNRHLQARQIGADAAMDAETEGGVAIFLAINDDLIGVREHVRIAVGSREREQHHLARLEGATVDRRLLLDLARHRHRRVGAQELLDGKRHQLRLVDQAAAVLGGLGQVPQARPDRAPGGVDASDQQKPQRTDNVLRLHRLAVELGFVQVANEIVGGLLQALVDMPHEIVGHLVHRLHQGTIVGDAVLQDTLDPLAIELAVVLRHAEQMRDQAHRNFLGVFGG